MKLKDSIYWFGFGMLCINLLASGIIGPNWLIAVSSLIAFTLTIISSFYMKDQIMYNPFKAHIREFPDGRYAIARINVWWPFGFSYYDLTGGKYWWWFDAAVKEYATSFLIKNAQQRLSKFQGRNKLPASKVYTG